MGITRFGSKVLSNSIKKWGDDILDDVKRIIVETCEIIQTEARALAPHDSGYLKKSIEIEYFDKGLMGVITVDAEYAVYVEYGTGIYAKNGSGRKDGWVFYSPKYGEFVYTEGMEAQPFWFDAIDLGKKHFIKEMKKLGR